MGISKQRRFREQRIVSNSHSKLSGGLASACLAVSGICLATSLFQTKLFIHGSMGHTPQANIMILGVCGALLGSQVLARLVGQGVAAKAPRWAILLGVLSIGVIELLSVGISTISFDGNLLATSRVINLNSPEYDAMQRNIARYVRQIDSLQQQADELPASYVTKRQELNALILDIQWRGSTEQQRASDLNVSTSDQAFNRLSETTGVSQSGIALIMGLLLSLVPMSINLLAGSLGWTRDLKKTAKAQTRKKPQNQTRAMVA